MPDIVVPSPAGGLFDGKSVEELEDILNNLTPDGDIPRDPAPVEPAPAAPVEQEAVAPDPPLPVEPEVPAEPDLEAIQRELDKAERDELKAKYDALQAHSSRLAGEVGFLKQRLQSPSAPSEPYEPQTQQELDRLTQLEQRLAQSESQRLQDSVSQAIAQELAKMDGPWTKELEKELAPKISDLQAKIQEASQIPDPVLARQTVRGAVMLAQAEARTENLREQVRMGQERKAATVSANLLAKKAQTPSGSGSVPTPPPKPKSYADMTAAEADAWLRENVR